MARLALGELAADGADGYGKVLADERDRARKIEGGAAKLRTGSKLTVAKETPRGDQNGNGLQPTRVNFLPPGGGVPHRARRVVSAAECCRGSRGDG